MFRYLSFPVLILLLTLSFVMSCLAIAEVDTSPPKTDDSQALVDNAIGKVYPALVQIRVVASYFQEGRQRKREATGSGVIISPDGYVVTNHHVAGNATTIRCILSSKAEYDAKLIGTDALTDLAVLKLNASSLSAGELKFAKFGDSKQLKTGDPVLAMGSPLAIAQAVTKGIVVNREIILPDRFGDFLLEGENVGLLVKWIAHDAEILPGNSGGPLVNLQGEIVGINEISLGFFGAGLGGAIPSELVKDIVDKLIRTSKIKRAWIGIDLQPLLKSYVDEKLQQKDENPAGVLVANVLPGSPADVAGVRAGDLLLSIDETPVRAKFREELPAIHQLLFSEPEGKAIKLTIQRSGKEVVIPVTTQNREDTHSKEQEIQEWGVVVSDLTNLYVKELRLPDKSGALITSVRSGGPADQALPPINEDDVILEIAGEPVANKETFIKITERITKDKKAPVPTVIAFQRKAERLLTVVEIGPRIRHSPVREASKAWLPVATQVVSSKLKEQLKLVNQSGVRISYVYPDSTAEKAGLKVNDIITQIDAHPIEASEHQDSEVFETMVRAYRIGSKVALTVIRDGKQMEIPAELAQQPKLERELKSYDDVELGFKTREISYLDRMEYLQPEGTTGVIVTDVERGGWADVGGLEIEDIIQGINQTRIENVSGLESVLKKEKEKRAKFIVFFIKRGIRTLFLELQPVWQ